MNKAPRSSIEEGASNLKRVEGRSYLVDRLKKIPGCEVADVAVDLVLSEHATKAQADEVWEKYIQGADILLIEHPFLTDLGLQSLQAVSSGYAEPLPTGEVYHDALITAAKGSRLVIASAEAPIGSSENDEITRLSAAEQKLTKAILKGEFAYEKALEVFRLVVLAFTQIQVLREKYIADHFDEVVAREVEKHPGLQKRRTLRIVMTMGNAHIGLLPKLRQTTPVNVIKAHSGTVSFPYFSEIKRRLEFDKVVTERSLELGLAELVLEYRIGVQNIQYDVEGGAKNVESNKARFMRAILETFSSADLEQLYHLAFTNLQAAQEYFVARAQAE